MIGRQRDLLNNTFAQTRRTNPEVRTLERLAQKERDLAEATAEFTEGVEARAMKQIPCLHEAQKAMGEAATALEEKTPQKALGHEEQALAALIQARQNLRQLLNPNSSSSSSARQFDRQQKQKLRPPPKEPKESLGQLRQEIEKLAKEEQAIAKECSGGGSGEGQAKARAERQAKAAEKAEQLSKTGERQEGLTDLARERLREAAESAKRGARSLQEGQTEAGGTAAKETAERLERLAKQVAGLEPPDANARLGRAEALARGVARQQDDASRAPRPDAEGQRGLAEDARTVDDLLRRLQEDPNGASPELQKALSEANADNPAQAAAEAMRRAADALQKGQDGAAKGEMNRASRGLGELASRLEGARRALTQPQLEKLLALEKQAAEAKNALENTTSERGKAEAEKKLDDLREGLSSLRQSEGRVAEAEAALAKASQAGGWGPRDEQRGGAYVPPQPALDAVRRTIQALQIQIQDVILRDTLLERDENVPPQFKALVEEYYRLLSEDLR